MNDDLEETSGLNNPESNVLTHNRFNKYIVLIFTDLKKAQIYKIPYKNSPHQEIEILISFDYLRLLRANEHTEDYHIRKPNDENFLFKIEDKKSTHVGQNLFSFETNDEIVKYSSEYGFNDVKFPLVMVKRILTLCCIKNISLFKNMNLRQKKTNISICIKKTKY